MGATYESAARLLRTGPSRSSLYEVEIPFSSVLGGFRHKRSEDHLRLFCKNISIPGVGHDYLDPTGYVNMGITRSVPRGVNYGNNRPLVLTVLENTDWTVYNSLKEMFDNSTVNNTSNPDNGPQSIRMNYYEDNLFTINLYKIEFADRGYDGRDGGFYREGYKQVCRFTFFNCYMTSIQQINLNSDAYDTALTYDCGFNYENYNYSPLI